MEQRNLLIITDATVNNKKLMWILSKLFTCNQHLATLIPKPANPTEVSFTECGSYIKSFPLLITVSEQFPVCLHKIIFHHFL